MPLGKGGAKHCRMLSGFEQPESVGRAMIGPALQGFRSRSPYANMG